MNYAKLLRAAIYGQMLEWDVPAVPQAMPGDRELTQTELEEFSRIVNEMMENEYQSHLAEEVLTMRERANVDWSHADHVRSWNREIEPYLR